MPGSRRDRTQRLERALAECERAVMPIAGVTGVSLGEESGEPCLVVYVERPSQDLRRLIAREYGGVPVRLEGSGRFEAQ